MSRPFEKGSFSLPPAKVLRIARGPQVSTGATTDINPVLRLQSIDGLEYCLALHARLNHSAVTAEATERSVGRRILIKPVHHPSFLILPRLKLVGFSSLSPLVRLGEVIETRFRHGYCNTAPDSKACKRINKEAIRFCVVFTEIWLASGSV
jgi:hypothetical protein